MAFASAVAIVAPVVGVTIAAGPVAGQDDVPSWQQPSPDAEQWVGADSVDDGALAEPAESAPKSEEFGEAGTNPAEATDVPGAVEPAATVADAAMTQLAPAVSTTETDLDKIRAEIDENGVATVNVTTDVSTGLESELSADGVSAQRDTIGASLDALDASLAGTEASLVRQLEIVPMATYEVDDAALDALLADPSVVAVAPDEFVELTLDVSTGVIDSDLLNAAGVYGNNFEGSPGPYQVAILDSGVDNQHAAFSGRIVNQACYSVGSDCPNGLTSQIGGNAADNCTYTPITGHCEHGTHVAGIAVGAATSGGHEGVASRAQITAIQIGSNNAGRWGAAYSDIIAGLQRVLTLRNAGQRIVAANMSIGIDGYAVNGICDAANANFQNTQNVAAQLQAAGVSVIASAGNSNLVGATYPACLTSVYSVSATTDGDGVAGFTNSGVTTDWWAPGVGTVAPIPPGPTTYGSKSGTSMAAPHVAGAWALMKECVQGSGTSIPNSTVASRLSSSGVNITDNGATRRRINVLHAATATVNNNDFAGAETMPAGGGNDFDWNVCSDTEPGEPVPPRGALDNGIWWNWTPSATGSVTISTDDGPTYSTTFDTVLSVYTGGSVNSLSLVGYDDDGGVGLRSSLTLGVNAGTTYRIKVDGYGGATGLLNLGISAVAPIQCWGQNATIVGNAGNDVLNGTPGPDVIVAGAGDDTINGNGGDDRICADAGNDLIDGGAGNDSVWGGSGADTIRGGTGDDLLIGNPGGGSNDDTDDTIDGEDGNDTLDGWTADDTLRGGLGDDTVYGAAGNDTIDGDQGEDYLSGGDLDDLIRGGPQDDRIFAGSGSDVVVGNGGDDEMRGGNDRDFMYGGPGRDTMYGGDGNDNVIGNGDDDTLFGGPGNDYMRGTDGNDAILGEDGNDRLFGENGNDRISGGDGADGAYGGSGNDVIDGGPVADLLAGNAGTDFIVGGSGNDSVFAGSGADTVDGGAGTDRIFGQDDDDTLDGGDGNRDNVVGGRGADDLRGGLGLDDRCDGSTDADVDTAHASCEMQVNIP